MPVITIIFGLMLAALGLCGFYANGAARPTALIPTWFGLGLILFGLLAQKRSLRMHAMHGAILVGLLGAIGALVAALKPAHESITIAPPATGAAGILTAGNCKWAMFAICVIFVVLCINSFIGARARRASRAAV